MKKIILLLAALTILVIKNHAQTVTDFDGNVYNIVTIGTQVWLKENLKTTHFNNGDLIPNVLFYWGAISTPAYCSYSNDSSNTPTYGLLYNWYTINDNRNMCPIGWHVPSDSEWTILSNYLGGDSIAGGMMKETGTVHWWPPNSGASNSSGFTGLPGGVHHSSNDMGVFNNRHYGGYFWSSTAYDSSEIWSRGLHYDTTLLTRYKTFLLYGLSVRCLRDSAAKIDEINYKDIIKIYPNPANNILSFSFDKTMINQNIVLSIFNMQGLLMKNHNIQGDKMNIDISEFPSGIYLVKVKTGAGIVVKKFVKQ